MDETINLTELGFQFAIENIDPKIGQFKAYQVSWDGKTGSQDQTPIKLEPCNTLMSSLKLSNEYFKARISSEKEYAPYLCPAKETEMKIRGAVNTEYFDYIKLSLVSCNPELHECADTAERARLNREFRIEMPEPIVNFEKSHHDDAVEYALNHNYAM